MNKFEIAMRLLLLFLASCGVTYTTSQGVRVTCEDPDLCYSRPDVEIVIDIFLGTIDDPQALADSLENMGMTIKPKPFECVLPDHLPGKCAGLYTPLANRVDLAYIGKCIAESALGHELGHAYHWADSQWVDAQHADRTIFGATCPSSECRNSAVVEQVRVLARRMISQCR